MRGNSGFSQHNRSAWFVCPTCASVQPKVGATLDGRKILACQHVQDLDKKEGEK